MIPGIRRRIPCKPSTSCGAGSRASTRPSRSSSRCRLRSARSGSPGSRSSGGASSGRAARACVPDALPRTPTSSSRAAGGDVIARLAAAVALAFGVAAEAHAAAPDGVAQSFLWVAVILVAARLGSLVERAGQPAVLGEILVGVVLGNLVLFGIGFAESMREDAVIMFLAQLGAVILLFQIGLESNVRTMRRVGARAFGVATIGVVAPFALGTWVVGPWLLPGLSENAYLFLGAALTATSVGITGRVFRDAGVLQRAEAQIVLGAAVIDDV